MNKYCPQPKNTAIFYENIPGAVQRFRDGTVHAIDKQGVRHEVSYLFEVPEGADAAGRAEGQGDLSPVVSAGLAAPPEPNEQGSAK